MSLQGGARRGEDPHGCASLGLALRGQALHGTPLHTTDTTGGPAAAQGWAWQRTVGQPMGRHGGARRCSAWRGTARQGMARPG
jgi:hypothetical protein